MREQSLLGMPGALGQATEQSQAYARIKVRLGEDPANQLLELKPQKPAPSGAGQAG